jgi:hypothetical protein
MRKLVSISVIGLLSIFGASISSAETINKGGLPFVPAPSKDQFLLSFNQSSPGLTAERYSHKVVDPDLNNPGRSLPHYLAVLPACKTQSDVTCVESVESKKSSDTSWIKGQLSQNQLDVNKLNTALLKNDWKYGQWPADKVSASIPASKALPAGGVASSWELAATPHSGGNSFLAEVTYLDSLVGLGDGPVFSVNIEPWNWNCVTTNSCDFFGTLSGPRAIKLQEDTEFRITIRVNFLADRIGKWAIGRLGKPSVSLQNDKLVIEGSVVGYPMGYALLNSRDECSKKLSSSFKTFFPLVGDLCLNQVSSGMETNATDKAALSLFEAVGDQVKENATIQAWTFTTVPTKSFTNECLSTSKFSLASSNAMLYSNLPPVWNKADGSLNYKIASTHLNSKGELNKGNYSLAIPKSVADCLWNFDVSKGVATISITNPNGDQNVAVSTLRTSNNWIYFDEVKVKFSQSPSVATSKPVQSIKKIDIICIKGKILKKVSAINPKCPNGFKKK